MRYVLLVLATLFAIDVSSARAEPLAIFQVTDATMFMGPNGGGGDNVRFTFTGPGLEIKGFGGMACFSWCSGAAVPLDTPTELTQIFLGNFSKAVLGGVAYNPEDLSVFPPGFFDESGGLNSMPTGFFGSGETFSFFRMLMPNGGWSLNFKPALDENGNPARRFVNGTFSAPPPTPTPEPGTFGLLLAGSAGIKWITRRRRHSVTSSRPGC
jgi:hypothetical protein